MAFGSIFLGSLADRIGRRPTDARLPRRDGDRHVHGHDVDRRLGGLVTPVFALIGYDVDAPGRPRRVAHHHWPGHRRHARRDQRRRRRVLEYAAPGPERGHHVDRLPGRRRARRLHRAQPGCELAEWRSVFYFGAAVTVVMIPIVYFLMPESVHWLARKQPDGRARQNQSDARRRIGHRGGCSAARRVGGCPQAVERRTCSGRRCWR